MTPRQKALSILRRETDDPEFRLMSARCDLAIPVCERPQDESGYDVFSVHWTITDNGCHYTIGQEPIIKDYTNWQNELRIPNIERLDWSQYDRDAAEADRDEYLVGGILLMGPFERTTALTAFDDCLAAYMLEPESVYEVVGAIADYKIKLIRHMHSISKLDILTLHDDWGTSRSLFLSPETWNEIIRPHTKRIYDAALELGIFISQHTCGCVTPLIPEIIKLGAVTGEFQGDHVDDKAVRAEFGDSFYIEPGRSTGDMPPPPNPEGCALPCGFLCPPHREKPLFLYD